MKAKFEGLYYKQQANGRTLALIPGKSGDGAFIHVITDKSSMTIPFKNSEYQNNEIFFTFHCSLLPPPFSLVSVSLGRIGVITDTG